MFKTTMTTIPLTYFTLIQPLNPIFSHLNQNSLSTHLIPFSIPSPSHPILPPFHPSTIPFFHPSINFILSSSSYNSTNISFAYLSLIYPSYNSTTIIFSIILHHPPLKLHHHLIFHHPSPSPPHKTPPTPSHLASAVPTILKTCTEVLETQGVIDGIYRLSGAASTIIKLRWDLVSGCWRQFGKVFLLEF